MKGGATNFFQAESIIPNHPTFRRLIRFPVSEKPTVVIDVLTPSSSS